MKKAILSIIFRKNKDNYEYLLLKRIPSRGGFWQPVSGRVEEGESELDAAKREVIEETGIEDFLRVEKGFYDFILENEPDKKSFCFGFEIDLKVKITLDPNEHSEYKWCSFDQSINLIKWPHNKKALKRLQKSLG